MDSWHATFLGLRHLPREVTAFEIEVFFQFSAEEARIIEERRRPELKLELALQMGFLRMSGRLLDAVRIVPPVDINILCRLFQHQCRRGAAFAGLNRNRGGRNVVFAVFGRRRTRGSRHRLLIRRLIDNKSCASRHKICTGFGESRFDAPYQG